MSKTMFRSLTRGIKGRAGQAGIGIVVLALTAIPALSSSGLAQADTCGGLLNRHTCVRPEPEVLLANVSWDSGYYTGQDSWTVHLQWEDPVMVGRLDNPLSDVQLRVLKDGMDLNGWPRSIMDSVQVEPLFSRIETTVPSTVLAGPGNYCFSVQDKSDENLVSDWSQWACVNVAPPPLLPPGAPLSLPGDPAAPRPSNLHVVANELTAMALGWTYSGHADGFIGFRLYRDNQMVGTVEAAAGDSYQNTDGGLELRHTYTYKVCTLFRDGDILIEGLCSDPLTVHTLGVVSPRAAAQTGPRVSP